MTPMIDVVFLLIIFFLISSHLAKRENQKILSLPMAQTGEKVKREPVADFLIHIDKEGTLWHAGNRIVLSEFQRRLSNHKNKHGNKIELRVRADREVAYHHIEPVLLFAAKTNVWTTTFKVYKSSR